MDWPQLDTGAVTCATAAQLLAESNADTNCSETMSTTDGDYYGNEPLPLSNQRVAQQLPKGPAAQVQKPPPPRSVHDRPATPLRARRRSPTGGGEGVAAEARQPQTGDDSPQANESAASALATSLTSLASALGQAPPSYGTATRTCASLDAAQLSQFAAAESRPTSGALLGDTGKTTKTTSASPAEAQQVFVVGAPHASATADEAPPNVMPINHVISAPGSHLPIQLSGAAESAAAAAINRTAPLPTPTSSSVELAACAPGKRQQLIMDASAEGSPATKTATTMAAVAATTAQSISAAQSQPSLQLLLQQPPPPINDAGSFQSHRKRRRHRSTSGRSFVASSVLASMDIGGSSTVWPASPSMQMQLGAQLAADYSGTSRQLRTMDWMQRGQRKPQQRDRPHNGTMQAAPPPQRAISAQCWLIDSSDEQTTYAAPSSTTMGGRRHRSGAPRTESGANNGASSNTMGSNYATTTRGARTMQQQIASAHLRGGAQMCPTPLSAAAGSGVRTGGHLTVAVARQAAAKAAAEALACNNSGAHASTLADSLKPDCSPEVGATGEPAPTSLTDASSTSDNALDDDAMGPATFNHSGGEPTQGRSRRRRTRAAGASAAASSSVLRLSTLLGFVANLVRVGGERSSDQQTGPEERGRTGSGGRRRARSASNGRHNNNKQQRLLHRSASQVNAPMQAQSVDASCACTNGHSSRAPSSAYMSMGGCGGGGGGGSASLSARANGHPQALNLPSLNCNSADLSHARATGSCYQIQMRPLHPPAGSTTTGSSSIFYSSSGVSSSAHTCASGSAHNAHLFNSSALANQNFAYEYCVNDDLDVALAETRFVAENERSRAASSSSSSSSTAAAATAAAAVAANQSMKHFHPLLNERSQRPEVNSAEPLSGERLRTLMSDSELMASDEPARGVLASAARTFGAEPVSVARRRWYWLSMKHWLGSHLLRRSGATSSSSASSSDAYGAPEVAPVLRCTGSLGSTASGSVGGGHHRSSGGSIHPAAARYRSLRPRDFHKRSQHRRSNSNRKSSLLCNIVSLAKADSVFRCRLIASVAVSLLLLALIGLLASLIHRRTQYLSSLNYAFHSSGRFGSSANKLHTLLDDSDQDLAWLVTPDSSTIFPPLSGQHTTDQPATGVPMPKSSADKAVNSLLDSIEQSDQLGQVQLTLTHLTNVQLANDNYIDLIQMSSHLAKPLARRNGTAQSTDNYANRTATSDGHFRAIGRTELELGSLALLSNIYWPLVKWRHQSQRHSNLAANLLSFAIMPSQATLSGAGSQTLRNFGALLMLADALGDQVIGLSSDEHTASLRNFIRLERSMRETVAHLVSCSVSNLAGAQVTTRQKLLRHRLCNKLLDRYQRLMSTLARLDYSQVSEMYDGVASYASTTLYRNTPTTSRTPTSRTLLNFVLDHLSVLDARLIAESVLSEMHANEPDEFDETYLWTSEADASGANEAIESMLSTSDNLMLPSKPLVLDGSGSYRWQQVSYLYELARSVLGVSDSGGEQSVGGSARILSGERLQANDVVEQPSDLMHAWTLNRLPLFARPLNYDLFLHPNLTTKLVLGMVKIEFELARPTRALVLSCGQLNLIEANIWLKPAPPLRYSTQEDSQKNGSAINSSATTLKQIPIHRIVRHWRLDQVYIELGELLEPARSGASSTGHSHSLSGSITTESFLEFGDLAQSQQQSSTRAQSTATRNVFVLNISFNKTNLMQQYSRGLDQHDTVYLDERGSNLEQPKSGLKFVYYADYFAQPEAELKTLLHTQFEPDFAHHLFPCFDEPLFKARFQLNLVHDSQNQVLFNAPKREKVPYNSDGSIQMSVFESTPIPISIHMFAFVVCDTQNIKSITSRLSRVNPSSLESTPNKLKRTGGQQQVDSSKQYVQVQILAQFEHLAQAEFASQIVAQLLAFYQTHLQLDYPMDKLDLVAIPRSLQLLRVDPQLQQQQQQQLVRQQPSDNVENFGLIWFRAPLLLVDTNLISQDFIEQISLIISHQLAHQYFGNIVGLRRWSDLWLYEALCQYLEPLTLSSAQPDWHLDEQFAVSSIADELALERYIDGQASSSSGSLSSVATESHANERRNYSLQSDPSSSSAAVSVSSSQLNSAVLHMLLFNLLPSPETRARLLRRCLSAHKWSTMSTYQFYRHFGEQLTLEASIERLSLEIHPKTYSSAAGHKSLGAMFESSGESFGGAPVDLTAASGSDGSSASERTVYVRPIVSNQTSLPNPPNMESLNEDQVQHRSHRLVDNLDALADAWISRQTYPLVSASIHRDRLELYQERFEPAWLTFEWASDQSSAREPSSQPTLETTQMLSDEPRNRTHVRRQASSASPPDFDSARAGSASAQSVPATTWPIPIMFVSRLNPKSARFFWFNSAHAELSLSSLVDPISYTSTSTLVANASYTLQRLQAPNQSMQSHAYNWFKLNVNQSSLIRVNYDERNWEALTEMLTKAHYSNHLLNPLDRANILDDALTLMRAGRLSVGLAMNLTLYLEVGERDYQPWSSVLRHLDSMQTLLNQNPLWHRYVSKLLQPISVVIGWKDDGPHLMRKLRKQLFSVALHYADEKTLTKAKQDFKAWLKSGRFIVPNLQELVYVAGVRYGDQQEWFHCWQRYQQLVALDNSLAATVSTASDFQQQQQQQQLLQQQQQQPGAPSQVLEASLLQVASAAAAGNGRLSELAHVPVSIVSSLGGGPSSAEASETNVENEKRQLLTALASTQNTWLLEQFLNYSIDSTKIQSHHLKHVVQTLGKNPVARLYLWRFVRLNWLTLLDRYEGGGLVDTSDDDASTDSSAVLESMIIESTRHFATKLDYDEVKAFFDTKRAHHQSKLQAMYSTVNDSKSPNELAGFGRPIERAIQTSLLMIKSNIYWRDHIEPDLTKWLSHYGSVMMKK